MKTSKNYHGKYFSHVAKNVTQPYTNQNELINNVIVGSVRAKV